MLVHYYQPFRNKKKKKKKKRMILRECYEKLHANMSRWKKQIVRKTQTTKAKLRRNTNTNTPISS